MRHVKFSNHAHPTSHPEADIDVVVTTVVEYYCIRSIEWGGEPGGEQMGEHRSVDVCEPTGYG